jgi:hypothetical protein
MNISLKSAGFLVLVAASLSVTQSARAAVDLTSANADLEVVNIQAYEPLIAPTSALPVDNSPIVVAPQSVVIPEPGQSGFVGGAAVLGLAAFSGCRRFKSQAGVA